MRVVELTYPTGAKCVMHPDEDADAIHDEIAEFAHDFYSGDDFSWSVRVFDMPESEFEALPEFAGP